jgi:hypothetical protein
MVRHMNAENYAYFLASDWSTRRKPLLQPATPTRAPVVSLLWYSSCSMNPLISSPLLALSELPLPSPVRLFCVRVRVVVLCVSASLMHNKVRLKLWVTYVSRVFWSVGEKERFLFMQYKCRKSDHQQLQRPKRLYGMTTIFFHSLSDWLYLYHKNLLI